MQQGTLTTAQEDMNQILAGLPVQNEMEQGQYNPNFDNGPKIPPLTQEEIQQIFDNIEMPKVTEEEINKIFGITPTTNVTNEDTSQIIARMQQQQDFSSEEANQILSGSAPEVEMNPLPQETQMFESMPQY
jgi:hypothetical protein